MENLSQLNDKELALAMRRWESLILSFRNISRQIPFGNLTPVIDSYCETIRSAAASARLEAQQCLMLYQCEHLRRVDAKIPHTIN